MVNYSVITKWIIALIILAIPFIAFILLKAFKNKIEEARDFFYEKTTSKETHVDEVGSYFRKSKFFDFLIGILEGDSLATIFLAIITLICSIAFISCFLGFIISFAQETSFVKNWPETRQKYESNNNPSRKDCETAESLNEDLDKLNYYINMDHLEKINTIRLWNKFENAVKEYKD